MKGFIITTIIFILSLTAIFINIFFVEKTTQNMKNQANSLKPFPCTENIKTINNLLSDWKEDSILLGLSVSYDNIEELTNIIYSLKAANEAQNFDQFKIHIELLLNAIEEIGRLEKFSIKNIL